MNKAIKVSLYISFVLIICALSKNIMMLNTSDFGRAIKPLIEDIPAFTYDLPLLYKLKGHIDSIDSYEYISSYSYILYTYVLFISIFTEYLDARVLSLFLKVIYIYSLYTIFTSYIKTERYVTLFTFFILAFLMCSSSTLSMFASFYQEQIVIIFLPFLVYSLTCKNNKSMLLLFFSLLIISTAKNQFILTPLIVYSYYIFFDRHKLIIKSVICVVCLLASIFAISYSKGVVELNKYHATYFGSYLYMKNNGYKMPSYVDDKCVGLDAWGNKFDISFGAIPTEVGTECFESHKDETFSNALFLLVSKPSTIFKLPFDDGVMSQYKENYFHVYKKLHVIYGESNILTTITNIKDNIFKNIRFISLLLFFIASIFIRNNKIKASLFVVSLFGISQFYVSFFGEGYRDLSKHLFGMYFSFDLCLYITVVFLIYKIIQRNQDNSDVKH
ncbi:hypothetical protein [Escherichia coli]|uniref:hypothetical protein n=2 Tax=Escherichia coli TaxID=562 RepID=UPI000DDF0026|nr:hypothetical protein [Escherichia coli]EFA4015814.1 hypothetical protein [Escherichia coli]EFH4054990.1 hypothetical protein [Escherichia coli]EGY1233543.1 hypothetical protein [Escherichia coli]EIT3939035.1 hypothetical protein [Escherichia coli]EJN8207643.1 hypothetical protein [Escherichia coli]